MEPYTNTLTIEQIQEVIPKLLKEHIYLTYKFCLGFIFWAGPNTGYVAKNDTFNQNGKRFVLMEPKSRLHQIFLDLEKQEDIHFERLSIQTMRKILKTEPLPFCAEDGSCLDYLTDPPKLDYITHIPQNINIGKYLYHVESIPLHLLKQQDRIVNIF